MQEPFGSGGPRRPTSVLVTGSAGAIGRAAVKSLLARGRAVRGFDRVPTPETPDFVIGDLSDSPALAEAATGMDAIIHLAAVPDEDDFITQLLPNNIVGMHNVLEAARRAGVKRILLASTGQVVWWQLLEGPWPIRPEGPFSPRDWYAVSKIASEAAGQVYARRFHMSVLAIRLGWFPRNRQHAAELAATDRGPNIYLSPGDAGRFFDRAIEAPLEPCFAALFVASRPINKTIFDLEPTRHLLGWEPLDQWPTGAEALLEAAATPDPGKSG